VPLASVRVGVPLGPLIETEAVPDPVQVTVTTTWIAPACTLKDTGPVVVEVELVVTAEYVA
jgi:hypothetical protein